MIIRRMHITDLESVVEIERSAFLNPWSRDSFLHELKHPYSYNYVIFDDAARHLSESAALSVHGYACFNLVADELHLLKMAVHPEMRQKNIGLHLLEKCFRDAVGKNVSYAVLEVRQSNQPAINFYVKLGFDLIAVRPGYYLQATGKREDALIMRKILKGGEHGNKTGNQRHGKNRENRIPVGSETQ
jgi:[ribosomal protein S18]-alanine N-acetyltransferase